MQQISTNNAVVTNKRGDFYDLWQQHKQLKIMVMSEIWPVNLDQLTKFSNSSKKTKFEYIVPWKVSRMIMKTVPTKNGSIKWQAVQW